MNIQEIEKKIVSKVLNDNQAFDKAVLNIFGYHFVENSGFSFPLEYFKNGNTTILPVNWTISDDIKVLLNLMFKEGIKTNKGTLTIYPSGEYLSEFIWDNEMYLSYCLADIENWLTSYFEQSAYRIEDKCIQLGIKWDFDVKVVISFTSGKANPVLFVAPNKPEINFKLYLDQLCECIEGDYIEAFEQWSITRAEDAYYVGLILENEEMYHSMNYGELKGRFQHWNSAAFIINKTNWQNLTFEDIKFEWKEENA